MESPVTTKSTGLTRKAVGGPASGKQTMVVRAVLHGVSTIAGSTGMQTMHDAPMLVRMVLYAGSWIACALAYLPILFLRERLVEAWDDRTRRIVRDEFERCELRAYKRDIDVERVGGGDRAGDRAGDDGASR